MCHVCRRSLLAGERFRIWRYARRDASVCAICEEHARAEGWIPVLDFERVRVGGLTPNVRRVA